MGERAEEKEAPTTQEDDKMVDSTGGPGSLARHERHDGRVAAEEVIGSATAAGELDTKTAGGNSQSLPVVSLKLDHAVYVVQPGRYFVNRLLRLANLYPTGEK